MSDGFSNDPGGLRSIAVYCGSSRGLDRAFVGAAEQLGRALGERRITLVYGGSHAGLMGVVADAALAAGGRVIGVIPGLLAEKELAHEGLSELHVVDSMHQRKARMSELAEAFVALPGGIGTLEEIVEMFVWAQIGIHRKPCALLNAEGYYDGLVAFLQTMVGQGFMRKEQFERLLVAADAESLLEQLKQAPPPLLRADAAPQASPISILKDR